MREKIKALLAQNPKISLGEIAKELNISDYEVLLNLPEELCKAAGGERFSDVIKELEGWGEVLFVKNTPNFIIEFRTKIPSGRNAQGFYNFGMGAKGEESHGLGILGGHLRADAIEKIFFVTQTFMGLVTKSVQFYDKNGENIFKIYVARDEKRELSPTQVKAFEEFKAKL